MTKQLIMRLIIVAVLLAAAPLITYFCYFHSYPVSLDPKDWGPFGDYVGGLLNPVISLLAFCAIIGSLWLQQKEITGGIDEFRHTTIESNLWQLMRIHNEISDDIVISTETNSRIRGRACFQVFHRRLRELYDRSNKRNDTFCNETDEKRAQTVYDLFLQDYEVCVSTYFKLLERILVLISKFRAPGDEKRDSTEYEHVETMRASLSYDELVLLFFHGACKSDKLKSLIEQYNMLKNLPDNQFPRESFTNNGGIYKESAFGEATRSPVSR